MSIWLILLASANPILPEEPRADATASLRVTHAASINEEAFDAASSAVRYPWVIHTSISIREEGALGIELRVIEFE